MARYVMISPNPEDDVQTYMKNRAQNKEAEYAVITVTEPFIQPFERIPTGYKHIMEYLQANNFKDKQSDNILGCFEYEYEKDGVTYMDIFIHAAGVTKADAYSTFN